MKDEVSIKEITGGSDAVLFKNLTPAKNSMLPEITL